MTPSLVAPIVFLILFFSTIIAVISLYLVFPREMRWLQTRIRSRLRDSVPLSQESRPWFWKGVAGSIGYVIGGPMGLIAGVVFGHSIAREPSAREVSVEHDLFANTGELPADLALDEAQAVFFLAVFALAAKVPAELSRETQLSAEYFITQELRLDRQRRELALNIFSAAGQSSSSFRDYAQQFSRLFFGRWTVVEQIIEILDRLAGGVEQSAVREFLFNEALQTFGLSAERLERLRALLSDPEIHALNILGLNHDSTLDEIRRKYRQLVIEYQPERVISDGVASEFLQLADRKFHLIQAAYEQVELERRSSEAGA